MASGPDLVIVGQVTVDHVVPASPGPWVARLGGNALFAAAGARLWMDPARVGLVARIGPDMPFDVPGALRTAGIGHWALAPAKVPHLTEWIIYEPDGTRRCLPRNAPLLDYGAEGGGEGGAGAVDTYLDYLLEITPTAAEIPPGWLPAAGIHLAPQVRDRHRASLATIAGRAGFVSVDPSPFYARSRDAAGLRAELPGCDALLPSELEIGHVVKDGDWHAAATTLMAAGFREVVLKRGAQPAIVADGSGVMEVTPPSAAVLDPTGAGDSFCGAYAACRVMGLSPVEAARRACAAASLVVETGGAEAALAISPAAARERLDHVR
jgi:sugar/nucleoside kinase (ribokinase family)